ncbi:antirestriction protein ArdA [Bifidobacterium longum]|uniref:antirestriction protein ArdA n=1 Tax=Bifidobacterium longum TaxID=216816 RepID=UPI0006691CFE|nr:antirestriction protein ArdA [Bifidobacterium longum]
MDGLKDYQISVYVANLGKYVEGVLQGAWITLPMPAATGDAVDVLRETMGAMPAASVGEDDGVSPIDLDLGYVLPGAVTSFAERAQACDPSDPLNMTDTAGSGLSK